MRLENFTYGVYNGVCVIRTVVFVKGLDKELVRLPKHVVDKLLGWVEAVETEGLQNVRRRAGYHDEPLRGRRSGQRSIRLTRSWRAVFVVIGDRHVEFVRIEEVHHHEY